MAAEESPTSAGPVGGAPSPAAGNLFDEQRRNRRDTWLLIAGFVALLAFIGFGFDLFVLGAAGMVHPGGVPLPLPIAASGAAVLGLGSAWLGYRFGDRAVLASSFARPVTVEDTAPDVKRLMNVVTEVAIAAGVPMPRIFLIDEPDPNAFATGRDPDHASIAVTTGLLQTMNREELQGVIAHEMAHVRNFDIRKMTLVAALLGAVLLLSDWATRLRLGIPTSRDSKRRDGGSLGGPLVVMLLVVWVLTVLLTPLIGRLLATGVSRRREYLADASGAELTRNPLGLASALRKLEAATAPTARIYRGTAHLCIADPLGKAVNNREGWLADLFATHPPIADRVARLEAMGYRRS
jgi:heat shock protein HtpX